LTAGQGVWVRRPFDLLERGWRNAANGHRQPNMTPLPEASLEQLFINARTLSTWSSQPVPVELLLRLYELTKLGPTSANSHPTRFVFVTSPEAKERLKPALNAGNVEKTMSAPVTVIVAFDERYHEQMPKLMPSRPGLKERLAAMPEDQRQFVVVQSTGLESAFLMLAARALGLDCGPMGGFDRQKVDATLLEGTTWRSTLLINLGYGDRTTLAPRQPRLDFDDAARIV